LIARTGRPEHGAWVGRTVADLAAARGLPPAETSLHLLLEDEGQYWTAPTIKSQGDINHILSHPLGVPMTDGMALAPYGPLGHPTNPRSYGTFPRVLGRYARDWGVLSMEVAVQEMTSVPARRMGIMDRGLLRPGFYADITVFAPETVIDRETFQDPLLSRPASNTCLSTAAWSSSGGTSTISDLAVSYNCFTHRRSQ
jgi:N-acyl-D-amino-acid deacylase